jgi:hypothetical protein
METNNGLFKILDSENHKVLFRKLILTQILQNLNLEDECNCTLFDHFPYDVISLEILKERKMCLSYPNWLRFQHSTNPLANNIHWNVCVGKDTPHHLFRDGLNEANENILTQGFKLNFFTHVNEENSNAAFWLYTKETAEGTSFIATTMVFFGFNDLFLFDENGMCLNK